VKIIMVLDGLMLKSSTARIEACLAYTYNMNCALRCRISSSSALACDGAIQTETPIRIAADLTLPMNELAFPLIVNPKAQPGALALVQFAHTLGSYATRFAGSSRSIR